MKIDIKDLLDSLHVIKSLGARVGLPDDPTAVEIRDPQRLSASLDNALLAFRELRGGTDYLVSAEVNTLNEAVWIRFVQGGRCKNGDGEIESALKASFQALRAEVGESGGEVKYWGGDNYFNLSIPFRGPMRESFPEIDHLPWDEQYRYELERTTWECLRERVFRFSGLAESFAARCVELGLSHVLIPSVGLCVHPWLFAGHGVSVTATDVSLTALNALSQPDRWPRLYSRAAYERWDIDQSASYASQVNPDHFEQMPDLLNPAVRESLRARIKFSRGDWADLPLCDASVDAIFATNALPRESPVERFHVICEWGRVVRPGGSVFIAQHNFFDSDLETVLQGIGWVAMDVLEGERPLQPGAVGVQIRYSSG